MHVKQVMRNVPADKQCTCGSKAAKTAKPATAATPTPSTTPGRLRSLFRR